MSKTTCVYISFLMISGRNFVGEAEKSFNDFTTLLLTANILYVQCTSTLYSAQGIQYLRSMNVLVILTNKVLPTETTENGTNERIR
jgi:hypothetical protein